MNLGRLRLLQLGLRHFSSVSGLICWIDSNHIAPGAVAIAPDLTGLGHDASQPTAQYQPTLIRPAGGLSYLACGVGNAPSLLLFANNAFSNLTQGEAFAVFRADADPPVNGSGGLWTDSTGSTPAIPYTTGDVYDGFGAADRPQQGHIAAGTTAASICVYNVSVGTSNTHWTNRLNGTQLSDRTSFTTQFSGQFGICAAYQGVAPTVYFQGKFYLFLLFDRVLSTADRTVVLKSLYDIYGIVGV